MCLDFGVYNDIYFYSFLIWLTGDEFGPFILEAGVAYVSSYVVLEV